MIKRRGRICLFLPRLTLKKERKYNENKNYMYWTSSDEFENDMIEPSSAGDQSLMQGR